MLHCNIKYIVADGMDVRFYSDKRRAEQYMEPIDVKNGVYVGYDSIGRRLDISATDNACSIALAEAAQTTAMI